MIPVVVRSSGAPTVRGAGGALGSAESGPPIQSGWSMNPVVLSSFKSPIMYPLRRPMSTPENPRRFGSPASNSRTTGTSPCCLSGGTRSAASDARPTLASASLVSFDGLGAKNQSLSPTCAALVATGARARPVERDCDRSGDAETGRDGAAGAAWTF